MKEQHQFSFEEVKKAITNTNNLDYHWNQLVSCQPNVVHYIKDSLNALKIPEGSQASDLVIGAVVIIFYLYPKNMRKINYSDIEVESGRLCNPEKYKDSYQIQPMLMKYLHLGYTRFFERGALTEFLSNALIVITHSLIMTFDKVCKE